MGIETGRTDKQSARMVIGHPSPLRRRAVVNDTESDAV